MKDEKCCCNCLHCARWQTSRGVECHCDLTDRYLGYLTVMNTDNNCSRWEKETKWDEEEKHDKEVYNKAIDDFACYVKHEEAEGNIKTLEDYDRVAEQLKGGERMSDKVGGKFPVHCGEDVRCDEVGCEYLDENGECRLAGAKNDN